MNPYQILNVPKDASLDEIKKAYKKLALKYHPDLSTGDQDKFLLITQAYNEILELRKKENKRFTDIISKPKKTRHDITISLTLAEAQKGVSKKITLRLDIPCACSILSSGVCPTCNGSGFYIENKKVNLVFDDLKHQNQRYVYKNFYKNIDLWVKVKIVSDYFYVVNSDVHSQEDLLIFKAILGGEQEIRTPKGLKKIILPEGNIKDFDFILKENGLAGGDQIIHFKVKLPNRLTDTQCKLLNEFINDSKRIKTQIDQ